MTDDKFEKELINEIDGIKKHGWLGPDNMAEVFTEYLAKYRAFKAEKPTAPVSLVEDIKAYANNDASYATWRQDIEKILSSYTPVPDEKPLKHMTFAEWHDSLPEDVKKQADEEYKRLVMEHEKPTAQALLLSLIGDLSTALEYHDPNNALIDKADEAIKNAYTPVPDEKPTAPSSLVERLNKWSEGCYGYTDNPSKCPAMDEFEKIIREAESKARQYLMGLQDKEGR